MSHPGAWPLCEHGLEEHSPDPVLIRLDSERAELSAEGFASPALHALGAATAWTDTAAGSGQEAAAKEQRAPTSVHAKPGTDAAAARRAAAIGIPDQAPACVEGLQNYAPDQAPWIIYSQR